MTYGKGGSTSRGSNTPREALIDAISRGPEWAAEIVDALDHYLDEGPDPPVIVQRVMRTPDLEAKITRLATEAAELRKERDAAIDRVQQIEDELAQLQLLREKER